MSDFDPFDQQLRAGLSRSAGAMAPAADPGDDLERLRPRFSQARRRRTARNGALGSLAAVVLVGVGVLVAGGAGGERVQTDPADGSWHGATTTSVIDGVATSTTVPVPTEVPTTAAEPSTTVAGVPTVPPADGAGANAGSGPARHAAPAAGGSPAPVSPPPAGETDSGSGAAPPASEPPPAPAPPVPPVGGTSTLTSPGGSVTVAWTASSVSVLATAPTPGWVVAEVEQDAPTRVVVRFERGDRSGEGSGEAKVDVRVQDGRLVTQVE